MRTLSHRLAPFIDRGLLSGVPNPWQLAQGGLAMTPYVLSPDVTAERHYRDVWVARPVPRQLMLLRVNGLDHLSSGSGLRIRLRSVCRHLQLTWHEGMPVFDLQLAQTHPDGLHILRRSTAALLAPRTAEERRVRRVADRLFPAPEEYFATFLEPGGWIDRAAAFDYSTAAEDGSNMPAEYHTLTGFLEHCLTLPASPADVGWGRVPVHLAQQAARRWSEGGRTGAMA
ncbi:MAG: hypothetical protein ACI8PZ_000939 [Myxococcota bacterium]|jgi:hypothetical protein